MKNAMIRDFLQAFGPGAHIEAAATWRREARGCAFARISVDVEIVDGRGRVAARATDAHVEETLFVGYDEEDDWWHGHQGVRGCGEGGRAAAARCRELEQEDWGDTPISWFEPSEDGTLLPWEEELSDVLVGGLSSMRKGRGW